MSISLVHTKAAIAPPPQFNPSIPADFDKALQAAALARSAGPTYRHQYAKLAEAVFIESLPMFSSEVRLVGARKGNSGKIGKILAAQLDGPMAAALAALWSVRNARLAGIHQVFRATAQKPGFGSAMVRFIGQTELKRLIRRIEWSGAIRP